MTGSLKLPALELLLRMSPLAAIQSLLFAAAAGELGSIGRTTAWQDISIYAIPMVLGNGLLAFALNVLSFKTNKAVGALTLTIAANLKQCLTIILGIVLFQVRVGLINGFGMTLAVVGAGLYSRLELVAQRVDHAAK